MSEEIHYSAESLNRSYSADEIRNQRRVTMEALSIQPGEHVLDIGCGTGFLTREIADTVGTGGLVHALDISTEMVKAAKERCQDHPQVSVGPGDVNSLEFPKDSFDVVTCTQVLLYVRDVERALSEMFRVLRPGGRISVLETDWRGVVMHSNHQDLTDAIFRAWDEAVPSPHLPVRLIPLMHAAGLSDIRTIAIPLLNPGYDPDSFSVSSLGWLGRNAIRTGVISREECSRWREDIERLGKEGAYFFCVNRFLFIGGKP